MLKDQEAARRAELRAGRTARTLGFTLVILSCLALAGAVQGPTAASAAAAAVTNTSTNTSTSTSTNKTTTASAAAAASAKLVVASATTAAGKPAPRAPNLADTIKVNFTDCGARNIKEVRITPCPGDGSVCNINLGTNVTVEADFVAKHEASSLNEIIKGVIRGRELQFPEQRADPCKSTISPSCPIKPGRLYQYKATFEVKAHYPAIPVKVRYALANAAGDIVACVQISAKIVDPSPVRSSRTKPKKKTAAAAAA